MSRLCTVTRTFKTATVFFAITDYSVVTLAALDSTVQCDKENVDPNYQKHINTAQHDINNIAGTSNFKPLTPFLRNIKGESQQMLLDSLLVKEMGELRQVSTTFNTFEVQQAIEAMELKNLIEEFNTEFNLVNTNSILKWNERLNKATKPISNRFKHNIDNLWCQDLAPDSVNRPNELTMKFHTIKKELSEKIWKYLSKIIYFLFIVKPNPLSLQLSSFEFGTVTDAVTVSERQSQGLQKIEAKIDSHLFQKLKHFTDVLFGVLNGVVNTSLDPSHRHRRTNTMKSIWQFELSDSKSSEALNLLVSKPKAKFPHEVLSNLKLLKQDLNLVDSETSNLESGRWKTAKLETTIKGCGNSISYTINGDVSIRMVADHVDMNEQRQSQSQTVIQNQDFNRKIVIDYKDSERKLLFRYGNFELTLLNEVR